ncbi:MAG: transcriptional regulator NrdR [Anaerolineales bacterium]
MKCPYCHTDGQSQVVDTAHDTRGNIRRRRECKTCGKRYSTLERPIIATPMLVKSSGERQEFDREKLFQGIRVACAKRPVATADIHRLIDGIEANLQSLGTDEVSSRVVGDQVVEGLKELDPIAYIRYAIVYLGLDDLEAVRAETDKLLSDNKA